MLSNSSPHGTRILSANLTWVPIDSLSVGQSVITFDAEPQDKRYRMYRVGEITEITNYESTTVRVETTDGCIDVATKHPFFVKKWNKTMFREAQKLEAGDQIYTFTAPKVYQETDSYKHGYIKGAFAGDGSVPGWKNRVVDRQNANSYVSSTDVAIAQVVMEYAASVAPEYELSLKERKYNEHGDTAVMPVAPSRCADAIREDLMSEYPKHDEEFARGWLAGMFDTDGTYPEGKQLAFCQYEGDVFDRVCDYLDLLGYEWTHDPGVEGDYSGMIRLTPGRETGVVYDFLMEIRPKVARKRLAFAGNKRIGGHTTVNAVEKRGAQTVYTVDTTEGTLIAEGMLMASDE